MFETKPDKNAAESKKEVPKNIAEAEFNQNRLVEEKILEAQKELEYLVGGNEIADEIGDSIKSIGMSVEDVKMMNEYPDFRLRNESIINRAKQLFEKYKRLMAKAVALGMATMALGGAGDFKKSSSAALEKNTVSDNNSEQGVKADGKKEKKKKEVIESFEKDMKAYEKDQESIWELEPGRDPRPEAEETRRIIIEHIKTPQYLSKLVLEFNGDVERAKNVQKQRLENMNSVKTHFLPSGLVRNKTVAFYEGDMHAVVLPEEKDSDSNISNRHEYFHASTRADLGISKKTKEILKNSYEPLRTKMDKYYSDCSEMLVRKQGLDLEMEKLGIKKYGEKFTQDHYKKLLGFYKKRKLSEDSRQFMETVKPEYFEKIFNEVALNDTSDKISSV